MISMSTEYFDKLLVNEVQAILVGGFFFLYVPKLLKDMINNLADKPTSWSWTICCKKVIHTKHVVIYV